MSIRTLLWAKEQTVITSNVRRKNGKLVTSEPATSSQDKLVLIGIGDEASEHSWDALIGVEDLAVFVGCTRRAIQESLRRLERAGYIRCRETKVESGQNGWKRVYLLSAESPLFRGLIEVDFNTVERISRYQMRTFRDRHATEFIPSDSLRHRKNQPAHRQDEPGSHCPESSANQVRTARVNQVRTEGEPGSHCEGEPGSHPSFPSSDASTTPDPEGGRTDEAPPETSTNHQVATALVTRLWQRGDFAKVGAYESQMWQTRDDVAAALAAGYGQKATEEYLIAKLAIADKVVFVRRAFEESRLPDIAGYAPAPASPEGPGAPAWCGKCDSEGRDRPNLRRVEDENGVMHRCPVCHPELAQTAR